MTDSLPHYDQIRDPDEKRALADRGMDFALVASRFNEPIVNRLIEGAAATLVARGADIKNVDLIRVSGSFELPGTARLCADTGLYDAIIALGCVIRGRLLTSTTWLPNVRGILHILLDRKMYRSCSAC